MAGAGLLESTDGGQTFTDVAFQDPDGAATIRGIAVTPGDPSSILVGDSAGFIESSTNAGLTWTVVNSPTTGINLGSVANNDGGIGSLKPRPPIPAIKAFKLTNTRFTVGSRPPRGGAFVYDLSAASTSAILFERESPGRLVHGHCLPSSKGHTSKRCTIPRLVRLSSQGRRVGGTCVARTSDNAHRKRCTLYTVAAIVRRSRAGRNSVAFSGRIGRVPLAPGRYVAVLVARIGDGPDSPPRTAAFTIVSGS